METAGSSTPQGDPHSRIILLRSDDSVAVEFRHPFDFIASLCRSGQAPPAENVGRMGHPGWVAFVLLVVAYAMNSTVRREVPHPPAFASGFGVTIIRERAVSARLKSCPDTSHCFRSWILAFAGGGRATRSICLRRRGGGARLRCIGRICGRRRESG
jgi:hypothetical protein